MQRAVEIRRCITILNQYLWLNTHAKKLIEWWQELPVEIQERFLADESLLYAALGYENRYKDFVDR